MIFLSSFCFSLLVLSFARGAASFFSLTQFTILKKTWKRTEKAYLRKKTKLKKRGSSLESQKPEFTFLTCLKRKKKNCYEQMVTEKLDLRVDSRQVTVRCNKKNLIFLFYELSTQAQGRHCVHDNNEQR